MHKKIHDIISFISVFKAIWSDEILFRYPHWQRNFPDYMINWSKSLDFSLLEKLEVADDYSLIKCPRLLKVLVTLQSLSQTYSYNNNCSFMLKNSPFLKQKKIHEIQYILEFIKNNNCINNTTKFIEYCSGIGHLSHHLSSVFNKECLSLDNDLKLQKSGIKKYNNNPKVSYKQYDLINASPRIEKGSFIIGLHTCGSLANKQILVSNTQGLNKNYTLLNIGCCYYKLKVDQDLPLSIYAQKLYKNYEFEHTNSSLTLANRSHTNLSSSQFLVKRSVKAYRYGLHLFLAKYNNCENYLTLGPTPKALYQDSFENYAMYHFQNNRDMMKMKIPNKDILRKFYSTKDIKEEIIQMIACGYIRAKFGRALELTILLDRCIKLQELGAKKVQLEAIFDEKISPRNLGIYASF